MAPARDTTPLLGKIKCGSQFDFVDESDEVIASYNRETARDIDSDGASGDDAQSISEEANTQIEDAIGLFHYSNDNHHQHSASGFGGQYSVSSCGQESFPFTPTIPSAGDHIDPSNDLSTLHECPEPFADSSNLQSYNNPTCNDQGTSKQSKSRLEATLIRYFVQELSVWFDVCDPDRHFARLVPQRARSCPSLLHAILTASARHITSLPKYRNLDRKVAWKGTLIPDLTDDTALYYHNFCVKELLSLSGDLNQIHNEDLLAAAVVLRFYEEIDSPLENNDDKGVLLRILKIFVNAQLPSADAFPCSILEVYHSETSSESSLSGPSPHYTQAAGLRRACFCVAFRQELYKSFMNQCSFTLPLSRWDSFRTLAPAGDGTWADRVVLFCADVLEYCYGSNETSHTPNNDSDRWWGLARYAQNITRCLPPSFEPIYTGHPDSNYDAEEVFPEIWFTDGCHATATAHLELAKMLLVAFDPTRPKLGHGHMAAMKMVTKTMRKTVLRVCGIALSNRSAPSVFVDATMAISACGEYIEDNGERSVLLEVLKITEVEYAWPTGSIAENLRRAWED
ncbi:hypothetical protein AbraIFM66950_012004 [Aspergillus brasiliensis]|nr:hypothetical protein AbraIFM66950_012004 [Aspergillus brasiliensis]